MKKINSVIRLTLLSLLVLLGVIGCGGEVEETGYTISGTITDLHGTVKLSNGEDTVTVTGEGDTEFSFPVKLLAEETYEVLVSEQPEFQQCIPTNNVGVVTDQDISDVIIGCSLAQGDYTLRGVIQNLHGTIQLSNGSDVVTVTGEGEGTFSFPRKLFAGETYEVLVAEHPDTQLCDSTNNTGLVVDVDVTYIIISCTAAYKIGGTIEDLQEPIALRLNDGIEQLPIAAGDSEFRFKTKLLPTADYKVDFDTLPESQICRLEDRKGVIDALDITSINLHCEQGLKLGGRIDGLEGVVELSNNGNTLEVAANGQFSFSESYFEGEGYNAYISRQPATVLCSIEQGNGFFSNEDINAISITCVPRNSLAPSISSLWPTKLWPSAAAKLSGVHLADSTLTINGARIEPTYADDNEIKFNIPDLAAGEYVLEVNSPNGGEQLNVVVSAPLKAKSVSSGLGVTCSISLEDEAHCWPIIGDEGLFQLVSDPGDGFIKKLNIGRVKKVSFFNPFHACALSLEGKVVCWGNNGNGQLGVGNTDYSRVAVEVQGLTDVVDVAAGNFHSCAVTSDGSAYCWGYLDGMGSQTLPLQVPGVENAIQVVAGGDHACFRTAQHQVYCVGDNFAGQLGVGSDVDYAATPIAIDFPYDLVDLVATNFSNCVLDTLGYVRCWGDNRNYIIGALYESGRFYYTPTIAPLISRTGIQGISLGNDHSCANYEDGSVSCWGSNWEGQFGIGVITRDATRLNYPVLNLSGVTSVTASFYHSCALLQDQTVKCWSKWGNSEDYSPTRDSFSPAGPVTISGIENVVSMGANTNSAHTVHQDGSLNFWGYGRWSSESNPSFTYSPETPFGLADVASVDIGEGTCIHQRNGDVQCWGGYYDGRSYSEASLVPGLQASRVVKGDSLKCALLQDQSVSCWVSSTNNFGFGRNLTQVPGLDPIVGLDAKRYNACFVDIYGAVFCIDQYQSIIPEQIPDLPQSSKIAITGSHGCAITYNGDVYCWGSNAVGQLATTGIDASTTPLKVEGVAAAVELYSQDSGTCAKTAQAKVYCWGNRDLEVDTAEPREDDDFKDLDTIVTQSATLTCGLLNNGRVQCKGQHNLGALGLDGGYLKPNYPLLEQ